MPPSQVDTILSEKYARRGRARPRYTPVQARRWLSLVAVRLIGSVRPDFRPSILCGGSRPLDGIARGLTLAVVVSTAYPIVQLPLTMLSGFSVGHSGRVRFNALDFVMGPLYWAVSWVLLRWYSAWHSLLAGASVAFGTNLDWVLSIVCLVGTVRLLLFPLFARQLRNSHELRDMQPRVRELQQRHRGDRQRLEKELMELYRAKKVNPLTGCLATIVQIPVFLGLIHVLEQLDSSGTAVPRYGWTSAQFRDAAASRLFGEPITASYQVGSGTRLFVIAAVLVATVITVSYLTGHQMQSQAGWSPDPQQYRIQRILLYAGPSLYFLTGFFLPIGVVFYTAVQYAANVAQQQWRLHKYPVPRAVCAEDRPSLAFGLTYSLAFGPIAIMAAGVDSWRKVLTVVPVTALIVIALAGVREGNGRRRGGLGPLAGRSFLDDAAARDLVSKHGRGSFRLPDWLSRDLVELYLSRVRSKQSGARRSSRATGHSAAEEGVLEDLLLSGEAADVAVEQLDRMLPHQPQPRPGNPHHHWP